MKIAVVVVLCAAVVAAVPSVFDAQLDEEWQSFKATHDKKYSANMEPMRRLIWEQNVRHIEKHNLEADMGKHTYWMGVNKFADMTNEEFRRSVMGFRVDAASMVHKDAMAWVAPSNVVLPDTVDWRKNGYVTSVKDQQQCGSCWAFTAAGALEGQHFKKTGVLVSVSAQQMMDCSGKWGNEGCNGGLMDQTFTYIKAVKGIMNDTVYPYTAQDGKCKFNRTEVAATCTGFVDLPVGDEYALQVAVATIGPISAAIDASHEGFQMYKSGVYDEPDCSSTQVDHTLVIVGYGTMNNQAYWLAKNSWGTSWGLDGYIMMSRNKSNQCGIASTVSYPTV